MNAWVIALLCLNLPNAFSYPYISPMIIGRTFDMSTSRVGNDLYDNVNRAKIECKVASNKYVWKKRVKVIKDKNDVLDIKGQLSFQVKAGLAKVDAAGSYLKESTISEETTEVIVKISKTTINKKLNINTAKPMQHVIDGGKIIGQHFVKSITYGGILIASLKFTKKEDKEAEDIRATIDATIEDQSKAETFSANVKGQFQMLDNKTKENYNLDINYYATVPLSNVPKNMDDFIATMEEFGEKLAEVDQSVESGGCEDLKGGQNYGVPVIVELQEIKEVVQNSNSDLDFTKANAQVENAVEEAELRFIDLQEAQRVFKDFLDEVLYLPSADEQEIAECYDTVFDLQKKYKEALSNIDLRVAKIEDLALTTVTEEYDGKYGKLTAKYKAEKLVMDKREKLNDQMAAKTAEERVDDLYTLVQSKTKEYSELISGMELTVAKMQELSELYKKKVLESFSEFFVYTKPWNTPMTAAEDTIKFNNLLLKKGQEDMYNPATGEMTCPKNGYYLITKSETGKNMHLSKPGEDDKSRCKDDLVPFTSTEIKYMQKDAKVSVTSRSSGSENDPGNDMFMGILISPKDS